MIVVVGGGAAGMIAAWRAASLGAPTLLLEKGKRLGTKILISGGGKCNLTHAGTIEDVRRAFRQNEAAFLKPSLYRFTNDEFLELLTRRGLEIYTRPDGRVFPVPPADAKDVMAILERTIRDANVRVRLNAAVEKIETANGHTTGVVLSSGERITAGQVIVAAGGSSYPATGTTGDGWRWLREIGHTVTPLFAALAPLYLDPTPPADWSGVALRDCVLRARRPGADNAPGKERMRWQGDLLFTHKGVSGPTALGVSREIAEAIPEDSFVEVDTTPDEPFEPLSARILEFCKTNPRRLVRDFVETLVPNRLAAPLLTAARVGGETRGAYLSQKERARLVNTLKSWPLGRVRGVPLERGEVVAGGVALDEVESHTLRSGKIGGLYLCGEVLDIAGPVGGYNLQAAWSTGYVAGETAAHDFSDREGENTL